MLIFSTLPSHVFSIQLFCFSGAVGENVRVLLRRMFGWCGGVCFFFCCTLPPPTCCDYFYTFSRGRTSKKENDTTPREWSEGKTNRIAVITTRNKLTQNCFCFLSHFIPGVWCRFLFSTGALSDYFIFLVLLEECSDVGDVFAFGCFGPRVFSGAPDKGGRFVVGL